MTTTLATATGARNGSDYNAIQFFILFIILKCVCVCVRDGACRSEKKKQNNTFGGAHYRMAT